MAKVISLAEHMSQKPRRSPKEAVEAKILLFTGVRYERMDFASNRRKTGSKRAKNK
jgi:hypothetical protein